MNMLLPRDPVRKQIPLLVLRNCEADGGQCSIRLLLSASGRDRGGDRLDCHFRYYGTSSAKWGFESLPHL